MQFDVLGPLRVVGTNGTPIAMNSVAHRRLLSMLISRAGTTVSADFLAEHLELSPGALRTSVSRLRRIVGADVLVTEPPGYELRSSDVDSRRFEHLVDEARAAGDPERGRTALEEALALWRGAAYDEFAYESWATAEARRLTELRAGAIEDLAARLIESAEWSLAIAILESLIAEEPFRDRPRELLMRALADSGRRTDALRAFQSYRASLLEEVGTEPSAGVTNLDREIARGNASDFSDEHPGVFLMTDIVSSTRLWAEQPEAMGADLAVHDDIVGHTIAEHRGITISTAGDSYVGAFERVDDAVAAAVAVQTTLTATGWQVADGIHVRMGIHLGAAQRRGDGWYGPPLNETARIAAVAHGGQIVVSEPVASALPDLSFADLGEHRLRDLDGTRRLLQVIVPGLVNEFPALRSMGSYVTTLPAQRTVLIGRDDFVDDIRSRLRGKRLVTLLGPGGVGKTRVAIEAAGQELAGFPGGVFFADLTTAATLDDVWAAVVGGMRTSVPPDRSPLEHIASHVNDRPALFVVDNCEHVLEPAAEVIDALLTTAPDVKVLATSREAIRIYGENRVLMPSLDVDGPASSGVRLFTERALAADSTFEIDDAGRATVVEVVRRLDGIPLAIELAAAQVHTFNPEQILQQLDDRFRFLNRGSRQAPQRQRTLEGAVAWSYNLLDPDDQRAFRQLSICAGPFTLRTTAALLEVDELEAADHLDSLVTKSLVVPIRIGGQTQGYRYLETLRDFGRRELSEAGESLATQAALEAALLPPPTMAASWTALVNDYVCAADVAIVLEDATRRDAAIRSLDAGRLDAAAMIFSSCGFREDQGTIEITLQLVTPLAGRREELDPIAWLAVSAAKVELERLARRYAECFGTSIEVLAVLDDDDPNRGWFDSWRCALLTAIAPEAGIEETDRVLPRTRANARPPLDFTLSQVLATKATGLAVGHRLDDARPVAEEGLAWAPSGKESRDQLLAILLWIRYLSGNPVDQALQAEVAAQHQELGLAELCAAPGALCADLPFEARAAALVAAARRRAPNDIPSPYLLAFGWLAFEEGDRDRAAQLVATAELYDSSTYIGLLYLLAALGDWADDAWISERDIAVAHYLSPDHEAAAHQGFARLTEAIDHWDRRLTRR